MQAAWRAGSEAFFAFRLHSRYTLRQMKRLLRILGRLFFAATLLFIVAVIYSTKAGYTQWYFRVDGVVTVDGHKTSGYLHANTQKTILLVTRTDEGRPETYLVPLVTSYTIFDCGRWHPLRLLPIPMGDVSPPCLMLDKSQAAEVQDAALNPSLVRAGRSIQFSTASGKKVRAEW